MSLRAGAKLGPYEILAPLGAGGMGEVYRARDSRLNRDVAIKVLPERFTQDSDALARFEREARAVAALSHPNILGIFDFAREGADVYAVTELLEGRSLREEIEAGPLPSRRAVDYAIQIARGLAAAHEKGIVHRDLKPDNVFVTRDGRVKILDFGLAKRVAVPSDVSAAATASNLTDPGTVMGTVGYMSPEQVRGRETDQRTDIFSFGAILYEMLSGRPAFKRDTAADTTSAILNQEPPELAETGRNVSPALDRIVRHCLEKNPERRFGSAGDIAFDLEAFAQGSASSAASHPAGRVRAAVGRNALIAVLALAIPAAVLVTRRLSRPTPFAFHRLTFSRGTITGARFAADGQTIVYSAAWNGNPSKLFSTHLTNPGSSPLDVPDATLIAISTSNELAVGLHMQPVNSLYSAGTLARVPLSGGLPREVLDDVAFADWAPDGSELAVVHIVGGKTRVEYPIGKVLYETGGWVSHIRFSPDGKLLAFLDHPASSDGGTVSVMDLSGKKRDLAGGWESAEGLAWMPGGRGIYATGTRFGSASKVYQFTLSGKEQLLLPTPGSVRMLDVSRDGRMLASEDDWRAEISALGPGQTKERDLSNLDYGQVRFITPDGSLISMDESGEGGGEDGAVFIRKTDGSPALRLGAGSAGGLSPDGKWLASGNNDGTQLVLFPTGAGQPVVMPCGTMNCAFPQFLPDGKRLVFLGVEPGKGRKIFIREVPAGAPRAISPEGVAFTTVLTPSPDGKWIAALGRDGRPTVFPVDGGAPRPVPGTEPREAPMQWTPDGRVLYVTHSLGSRLQVFKVDVESGRRELWKEISAPDPAGVNTLLRIFPTPDGRAYAYTYIRLLSTLFEVDRVR
ncbi:MAG TPA: protein kinase [Thermoanaerobaculia bacterium]|nr:protein kinase [Thermoanaerobaculia bacterium]